jgi:hypothetical protein
MNTGQDGTGTLIRTGHSFNKEAHYFRASYSEILGEYNSRESRERYSRVNKNVILTSY